MNRDETLSNEALTGSLKDFRAPHGVDLIGRTDAFFGWQDERRQQAVWP